MYFYFFSWLIRELQVLCWGISSIFNGFREFRFCYLFPIFHPFLIHLCWKYNNSYSIWKGVRKSFKDKHFRIFAYMYIDFLQRLYQIYFLLLLLMNDCSATGANWNPCRLVAVVSCCARHVSLLQIYFTCIYHISIGFQDI